MKQPKLKNKSTLASQAPALTLVRDFDAPRDFVFQLWLDPVHLAVWWGPHGFTNPVCEIDPRVGGKIRIHMRGPDGTVYPMSGVYREIVRPERLVFAASALDKHGKPIFEVMTTVTFEARGAMTRLTLKAQVISTSPGAEQYLQGMEAGWSQSLERLAELVQKVKK